MTNNSNIKLKLMVGIVIYIIFVGAINSPLGKKVNIDIFEENYDIITFLNESWNLMSVNCNDSITLIDLNVSFNGSIYTWTEATDPFNGPIIDPNIYGWNRSIGIYSQISDILEPGYGYWMYSYFDCGLLGEINYYEGDEDWEWSNGSGITGEIFHIGNVGIGTMVPEQKLHVSNGSILVDNNQEIQFKDNSGLIRKILRLDLYNDLEISNEAGDILINSNGNVGIGTPFPSEKLDIAGTVQMGGLKMPTGAYGGYVLTSDELGVGTWQEVASGGIDGGGTNNYIPKFTSSSTIGDSIIYETGGNIGIGTINPTNMLHIVGSDSNPLINVEKTGSGRGVRVSTTNACAIWVENSGNHGLRITNAQGDGIHVTNAGGYAGYFNGDLYCTGKLTSDGGNDPPYVLYNNETRESIKERVAKEVPNDKLDGAVLFWNGEKMHFEVYLPLKGEFWDIFGNKLLEKQEINEDSLYQKIIILEERIAELEAIIQ